MSELDKIVQISISRESQAIETASFNIPLILASHTAFPERIRSYSSISAVGADFASTSNVYKIANNIFSAGTRKVPEIVVGRRQVDEVEGTVPTVTVGQAYIVTINGTAYSYTAVSGNSAANVVAGIKSAYDLAPKAGISFVNNGDGTFTSAVSVLGTAWSIKTSKNIILENSTSSETLTEAGQAVEMTNNQWYVGLIETHDADDVEEFADFIEARRKVFFTATQDPNVKAATLTDIAGVLSQSEYERTAVVYHSSADTEYPESSYVGRCLPYTIGNISWNFKGVSGLSPDSFTDTEYNNLVAKNCNRYTRISSENVFREGRMANGNFISEIMIIDWIYARMQEAIFSRLINLNKLPINNTGVTIVYNEMNSVLATAAANGAINPDYTVTPPDLATITNNDKILGILGTFKFRATFQGEVSKVVIEGTLTH